MIRRTSYSEQSRPTPFRNPVTMHSMITRSILPFLVLFSGLGIGSELRAQDPREAVKKILREVSEEMSDIDRLLRESSRRATSSGSPNESSSPDRESAKDLVDETRDSQQRVVRGIDQLVDQLQQMAQESSSSSSSSEQEQQDQQQSQQQQQRSQREQSQGSDYQNQQQDQQQQDQQNQDGQQPQGGQENPDGGQNQPGSRRPEDGVEEVSRGDSGVFSVELPDYAQFLHTRGGAPKVPAKYRRLHEAWLRRVNQANRR